MKFVSADEKGINVKLHPSHENRIFTDRTDDGQDIVIVKGRVVRVDERGGALGLALHRLEDPGDGSPAVPRLIETEESPTPIVEPTVEMPEQRFRRLQLEAAQMGFDLSPQVGIREGDSVDFRGRTRSEIVADTDTTEESVDEGATTGDSKSDHRASAHATTQGDKGSAKSGTLPKADTSTKK